MMTILSTDPLTPGGALAGATMPFLVALLALLACANPLPDLEDAHRDYTGLLPVFPGAEGFGTDTPAGRGGVVLRVTNLDDAGPGSLREAVEAEGARTVVFEVSGTVWLADYVVADHPFLTIAGQTAPSPGVTLAGAGLSIRTHDVLVQHLRVRPGDLPDGPDPEDRDAIQIIGDEDGGVDVYGVVVDHCSLSWATDENASSWYPEVRDLTWSHNLIAEGLWFSTHPEQPHSMGLLVGDHTRRAAVIGNVFAHNDQRNPYVKQDASALVVNNLIYDPGVLAVHLGRGVAEGCFSCPSLLTAVGNRMIPGPATNEWAVAVRIDGTSHDSRAYKKDTGSASASWEGVWVDEPPVGVAPLTVLAADDLEEALLDAVGARPTDRDAVDTRVVEEIRTRSGGPIDAVDDVGGWPVLAEVYRAAAVPEDATGDDDGDGYSNLEEWLHAEAAAVEGR